MKIQLQRAAVAESAVFRFKWNGLMRAERNRKEVASDGFLPLKRYVCELGATASIWVVPQEQIYAPVP